MSPPPNPVRHVREGGDPHCKDTVRAAHVDNQLALPNFAIFNWAVDRTAPEGASK